MKNCSDCKETKPETEFNKNQRQCKACKKAYMKNYVNENKNKHYGYMKNYMRKYYYNWGREDGAGIYCFKNMKGEIVYIGQTNRLKARKLEHKTRKSNSFLRFYPNVNWDDLVFETLHIVEDKVEREQLEAEMIKIFQPIYNQKLKQ